MLFLENFLDSNKSLIVSILVTVAAEQGEYWSNAVININPCPSSISFSYLKLSLLSLGGINISGQGSIISAQISPTRDFSRVSQAFLDPSKEEVCNSSTNTIKGI